MTCLSDEQAAALAIAGDGVVLAGAGAGKTRTLVALCVRDLLQGTPAEEVLVCTFTRAAAGQIKARLAADLAVLEEGRRIDQRTLRVGTIDAICADLVRERALELGLPPSFGLARPHETAAIREEAYQYARTQLASRLMDLSPLLDPSDDERLRKTIERIFERAASQLIDPRRLTAAPAGPGQEVDELARDLEDLADDAPGAALILRADARALREGRPEAVSDLYWRGLPYALRARAEELRARIEPARIALADPRAASARRTLAELVGLYAEWRQRRCAESGLLGYIDIAMICRQGIVSGAITRRFGHIYLDEAQDTNPLQIDILRRLRADPGRLLAIGDVSQSIYAWRLADPDGFAQLADEFPGRANLSANYRSSPHVLAAIGAIGAGLPELDGAALRMTPAAEARPADPPVACLVLAEPGARPPSPFAEAAACIDAIEERRRALGVGLGEVAVLCRSTRAAADWAEALRGRSIPALVLQRGGVVSARESRLALDYLRLVADPADDQALLSVLSGPLARLEGPQMGEVFGAPAGRRWPVLKRHRPALADCLRRHIAARGVLGVEELCRRALEEVGYLAAWHLADPSGTATRNLEGLLAHIGALAADGPDLDGVVTILDELLDAEGDEQPEPAPPAAELDAVRVMTMHGAKGEEFGLVVLAGMSQRPGWFPELAEVDQAGRLGVCVRGPNRVVGLIGDTVALRESRRQDEIGQAEERRLGYVAMTRAMRGLVIVLSGRIDAEGLPRFERMAEWLDPVIRGSDALPLPGEVRVRELGDDARIEIERVSPAEGTQRLTVDPSPEPLSEPSVLPACSTLAPAALSYTAISDWRRCGLRRHLESELGLGDPQRPLSGPAGATRLGRRIHRVLAELDWTKPLGDQLERAAAGLRSLGAEEGERARRILERAAGLSELTTRLAGATVRVEQRFALAEPFPLVGRIDVIAREGDGRLVVDWKTGADIEEQFTDDHSLQRDVYALACLSQEPAPERVDLAWVYLADEPARVEWTAADRSDLEAIRSRLERARDEALGRPAVAAADAAEPFCAGCPGLRRLCPVSR